MKKFCDIGTRDPSFKVTAVMSPDLGSMATDILELEIVTSSFDNVPSMIWLKCVFVEAVVRNREIVKRYEELEVIIYIECRL